MRLLGPILGLLLASIPALGQVTNGSAAGYSIPAASCSGSECSSVSVSWRQPTCANVGAGANGGIWPGIGGISPDTTLIQIGVRCATSQFSGTTYAPFYQLVPASAVTISQTVLPGDVMIASVACLTNCTTPNVSQTWTLTLQDVTQKWTSTNTPITYTSSLATADFFIEAPTIIGIQPMANVGSVPFISATVNGAPATFTTGEEFIMNNTNGQTVNPSAPSGSAFNACWGQPSATYTTCAAAGNLNFAKGNGNWLVGF